MSEKEKELIMNLLDTPFKHGPEIADSITISGETAVKINRDIETAKHLIDEARAEIGCAISQSIPKDDQIIMGHISKAYNLLKAIGRHYHISGNITGQHIDTCSLCGRDIRDDIHSSATLREQGS